MVSLKRLFLVVVICLLPFLGGCGVALVEGYGAIDSATGGTVTRKVLDVVGGGGLSGTPQEVVEKVKTPGFFQGLGAFGNKIMEVGGGLVNSGISAITGASEEEKKPASRVVQGLTPPAEFFVKILPDKRKIRFCKKNCYVWSEGDPPLPSSKKTGVVAPVKKIPWGKGTAI